MGDLQALYEQMKKCLSRERVIQPKVVIQTKLNTCAK